MYVFANSFRPLLGADKYVVYFPPLLSTLSELSGRRRAVTATCTAVTATCTAVKATCTVVTATCTAVTATCTAVTATCTAVTATCTAVTATCTAVTATCTAVTLTKVWAELELGYDMFRGNVICSGVI